MKPVAVSFQTHKERYWALQAKSYTTVKQSLLLFDGFTLRNLE